MADITDKYTPEELETMARAAYCEMNYFDPNAGAKWDQYNHIAGIPSMGRNIVIGILTALEKMREEKTSPSLTVPAKPKPHDTRDRNCRWSNTSPVHLDVICFPCSS